MPKAQAAMEFLLTYGWAIAIVIAAIGVMAYLGLTNLTSMSPNSCESSGGIFCLDQPMFDPNKNQIVFSLRNSQGYSIIIDNITGTGAAGLVCQGFNSVAIKIRDQENWVINGLEIRPETNFIVTINCTQPLRQGKAKAEYLLHYRSKNTNLARIAPITLRGVVS